MNNLTFLLSDQGKDHALFGFNGNILETNIINLAVVIGIVVYFGGDALRSLLLNRKQTISSSLQEADLRLFEAKDKLSKAKSQLDHCSTLAAKIRHQASGTAEQEKKQSIQQTQELVQRLEKVKQETQLMQQQKARNGVYQEFLSFLLSKVSDTFRKKMTAKNHYQVNQFYMIFFLENLQYFFRQFESTKI